MIEPSKTYRIKGSNTYFQEKYRTANPTIKIEDKDTAIWGCGWMENKGNPACYVFAMRVGVEGLAWIDEVWYGKIRTEDGIALGELVHESELEDV